MTPRKILTVFFFALVLALGYYSMNAAPVISDHSYTYQGGIEWHEDPDEAYEIAQEEDRPVLVYYWTTWCTYCDEYDSDHYRDDEIRDALDEYVLLAVNLDEPGPASGLVEEHEANYPPQHVVTTPYGDEVTRIGGYADEDTLLNELRHHTDDS